MRWLDGITDSMDMMFEQTLGDSERQGSLVCCSPWGHNELDMTEGIQHACTQQYFQPTFYGYVNIEYN